VPDLDPRWRAYVRRFDLEHTLRFCKQTLGWTMPRVRHPEQADRWTWLVVAASTQWRRALPLGRRSLSALGATPQAGTTDARSCPAGRFCAPVTGGHPGDCPKTMRALARPTSRESVGARHPLLGPAARRVKRMFFQIPLDTPRSAAAA